MSWYSYFFLLLSEKLPRQTIHFHSASLISVIACHENIFMICMNKCTTILVYVNVCCSSQAILHTITYLYVKFIQFAVILLKGTKHVCGELFKSSGLDLANLIHFMLCMVDTARFFAKIHGSRVTYLFHTGLLNTVHLFSKLFIPNGFSEGPLVFKPRIV